MKAINFSGGFDCTNCTQQQLQTLAANGKFYIQFINLAKTSNVDTLWVFAANNSGAELKQSSPARLSTLIDNVASVSGVDSQNRLAFPILCQVAFDYGQGVTVAAPDVDIFSDVPGGGFDDGTISIGGLPLETCAATGTSFAAPYVTGVAGLMLSKKSDLTASAMKATICETSDKTGSFDPTGNEVKLLDAFQAVQKSLTPGLDDQFDCRALNDARWVTTIVPSAVGVVAVQNQELEMTKVSSGSGYMGLATRCKVSGDFDVQVD